MASSVLKETAPRQITDEIERFCEEISPGQAPIFVSVMPQEGAVVNCCHINVDEHVKVNGGTPIYGWIIWQSSAILDAEFHCNWLSSTGQLLDITPKTDGERSILFLPDQSRQWTGHAVLSRRKARRELLPLSRFIGVHEQIGKIVTKYPPGHPLSSIDTSRVLTLSFESAILESQINKSWTINPRNKSCTSVDHRALRKAERQRRKQQRRLGK